MESIEIRKAASELRSIWVLGNEYLQSSAPWSVYKEDEKKAAGQIRLALNLVRIYAVLSKPFIPNAAEQLMTAMHCNDWTWPENISEATSKLRPNCKFTVPEVLFPKISDEECENWQSRFSGTRIEGD